MFFVVLVFQMLLQFSGLFLINYNPLHPAFEMNVLIFHGLHAFKFEALFQRTGKRPCFPKLNTSLQKSWLILPSSRENQNHIICFKEIEFYPFKTKQLKLVKLVLVLITTWALPAMQEIQVQSLGQEEPLEQEMANHSSTLAWRIPWIEEPGRLQSMELQKSWTQLSTAELRNAAA